MQFVDPEILADVCGLSPGITMSGLALGLALWLFGWRWHRFWIVLAGSALGGIYGLFEGPSWQTEPVVAALLLGLTAGLLALALVRLVAFTAGGVVGLVLAQYFIPSWEQPLIVFLLSGLASLLLFRVSLMALTSFLGAVLLAYAGLGLLNHYGVLDAVAWLEQGSQLLTWVCGALTLFGLATQFLLDRRRRRRYRDLRHDDDEDDNWDVLLGKGSKLGRMIRKAG
ncbi:MAG: hypothetical protein L0Y72_04095 [Gemmataceae bacterium]|nr:hypothetical protein [Gemmataceae bacterium]